MSKVKYFYVRNECKKRDITIASEIFDEDGQKYVKFGWSFRSNHDQFIKREGRKLAFERMTSGQPGFSATVAVDDFKFYDLIAKILDAILTCPTTPRKYIDDISEDLYFFASCAVRGKPKWDWENL